MSAGEERPENQDTWDSGFLCGLIVAREVVRHGKRVVTRLTELIAERDDEDEGFDDPTCPDCGEASHEDDCSC